MRLRTSFNVVVQQVLLRRRGPAGAAEPTAGPSITRPRGVWAGPSPSAGREARRHRGIVEVPRSGSRICRAGRLRGRRRTWPLGRLMRSAGVRNSTRWVATSSKWSRPNRPSSRGRSSCRAAALTSTPVSRSARVLRSLCLCIKRLRAPAFGGEAPAGRHLTHGEAIGSRPHHRDRRTWCTRPPARDAQDAVHQAPVGRFSLQEWPGKEPSYKPPLVGRHHPLGDP